MEKNEMIGISKESNRLALKVIVVPPTMLKNDFRGTVTWKSIKIVKPFPRIIHTMKHGLNFCPSCHCEERSDEAISLFIEWLWDCFVGLWLPRNDKWSVFQRSHHIGLAFSENML